MNREYKAPLDFLDKATVISNSDILPLLLTYSVLVVCRVLNTLIQFFDLREDCLQGGSSFEVNIRG
jgi:hypothetical protein